MNASVLGKLSPVSFPLIDKVPAFLFSVIEKSEKISILGVPAGVLGFAAAT